MTITDDRSLLTFYRNHLETAILPFWLERAIDPEYGGYFTCFDNTGEHLVSGDKYTWSQGRFIWLLAHLAEMSAHGLLHHDPSVLLALAQQGVAFIQRHAFLENGSCAFLLDRAGVPKESLPGQGFDTSFFADCFVILGFAEFARVSGDTAIAEQALRLYDWTEQRISEGVIRSEPYPVASGLRAHSVPMIMLNVSQELATALETYHHPRAEQVRHRAWWYLERIMEDFRQPDGAIREMAPLPDANFPADSVLLRHVTPGHMLESMWFVMTEASRTGHRDRVAQAATVVQRAFALGWDDEWGGLFRYADRTGGPPQGAVIGDPYERLVLDTWDTKLWWPHSEALYSTLLAYTLTGDLDFLSLHDCTFRYVFTTFPNHDPAVGEWVQIRDRHGQPLNRVVALPVKDPYHITRNLGLIIELLSAHPVLAQGDAPTLATRHAVIRAVESASGRATQSDDDE